jgi:hypothetical protein
MLTPPRNHGARYWLSDGQRHLLDGAARKLPAGEQHLFQLRVAKALRTAAHGPVTDSQLRTAMREAGASAANEKEKA